VLHRDAKTLSDKVASGLVRLARFMFDLVSGYKHVTIPPNEKMTLEELRKAGHLLDHHAWLNVSYANSVLKTLSSFC
jgi:ubiquinol oxidase